MAFGSNVFCAGPRAKPATVSLFWASSADLPVTSGIFTGAGPPESTSVTGALTVSAVPATGSVRSTAPTGTASSKAGVPLDHDRQVGRGQRGGRRRSGPVPGAMAGTCGRPLDTSRSTSEPRSCSVPAAGSDCGDQAGRDVVVVLDGDPGDQPGVPDQRLGLGLGQPDRGRGGRPAAADPPAAGRCGQADAAAPPGLRSASGGGSADAARPWASAAAPPPGAAAVSVGTCWTSTGGGGWATVTGPLTASTRVPLGATNSGWPRRQVTGAGRRCGTGTGTLARPSWDRIPTIADRKAEASLRTLRRVAPGGRDDQVVQRLRGSRCVVRRSRHVGMNVLVGNGHRVVAVERWLAGEHLVRHHAGGVDIGAGVGGAGGHLLGRQVGDRSEDHVTGGHGLRGDGPDQPEVGDLHRALGRDQHVLRFDVPVHQTRPRAPHRAQPAAVP